MSAPRPKKSDVRAALRHFSEHEDDLDEDQSSLKLVRVHKMWPARFAPRWFLERNDGSWQPRGWLRHEFEEFHLTQLIEEYGGFEEEGYGGFEEAERYKKILSGARSGKLPPGIRIDGRFGDGAHRAQVCHALGLQMWVADFETPDGKFR